MKHRKIRLMVSAFLDDVLTLEERRTVELHVAKCAECTAFLDDTNRSRMLIRGLDRLDVKPAFAREVADALDEQSTEVVTWLTVEHYARASFAVLAVAVMLLAMLTSFVQPTSPPSAEQFLAGDSMDSLGTHILFKQGDLSKGDVLFAVVSK